MTTTIHQEKQKRRI